MMTSYELANKIEKELGPCIKLIFRDHTRLAFGKVEGYWELTLKTKPVNGNVPGGLIMTGWIPLNLTPDVIRSFFRSMELNMEALRALAEVSP